MFNRLPPAGFRQLAKDVLSNSRAWAETGQEMAVTGSHRAKRFINKRPMTSTLIGLGVGYLFGKLFSKRKAAAAIPALTKAAKRNR